MVGKRGGMGWVHVFWDGVWGGGYSSLGEGRRQSVWSQGWWGTARGAVCHLLSILHRSEQRGAREEAGRESPVGERELGEREQQMLMWFSPV